MSKNVQFKGVLINEPENEELEICIEIPVEKLCRLAGSEELDETFVAELQENIEWPIRNFLAYIDVALSRGDIHFSQALEILNSHILNAANQIADEMTQKSLESKTDTQTPEPPEPDKMN